MTNNRKVSSPTRYRPELDGFRAVAVLLVLATHSSEPLTGGGWMGVDLFFVLSGFLITGLLLNEIARTGRARLRDFYARRALRLYPALLAVVGVGAVFHRQLGATPTAGGYAKTAGLALGYLEDLPMGLTNRAFGGFEHTWSLAVEEQFYLLWPPLLVWLMLRGRDPLRWALGGAIASYALLATMIRHADKTGPFFSYAFPGCRFWELLVGAALAIWLHRHESPAWLRSGRVGWTVALASIALVLGGHRMLRSWNIVWQMPAITLLAVLMLLHLQASAGSDGRASIGRLLSTRALVFVGRRSYGIYLYHIPVLILLNAYLDLPRSQISVLMAVITFVLATVSYRFLELPFLRLKRRFQPDAVQPQTVATTSMVTSGR